MLNMHWQIGPFPCWTELTMTIFSNEPKSWFHTGLQLTVLIGTCSHFNCWNVSFMASVWSCLHSAMSCSNENMWAKPHSFSAYWSSRRSFPEDTQGHADAQLFNTNYREPKISTCVLYSLEGLMFFKIQGFLLFWCSNINGCLIWAEAWSVKASRIRAFLRTNKTSGMCEKQLTTVAWLQSKELQVQQRGWNQKRRSKTKNKKGEEGERWKEGTFCWVNLWGEVERVREESCWQT